MEHTQSDLELERPWRVPGLHVLLCVQLSLQVTLGLTSDPSQGGLSCWVRGLAEGRGVCLCSWHSIAAPSFIVLTGCGDHYKTTRPVPMIRTGALGELWLCFQDMAFAKDSSQHLGWAREVLRATVP